MSYYVLTNNDRASVLYSKMLIDTTRDFYVTFDYSCYGNTSQGAHGFCLFLVDVAQSNLIYGGAGPGLGVTALTADLGGYNLRAFQGIPNTSLCVGFDINGIYGSNNTGLNGPSATIPNSITLRSSQTSGFRFLYRTDNLAGSTFSTPLSLFKVAAAAPAFNTFRIKITDFGSKIEVDHRDAQSLTFTNYVSFKLPYTLPSIVYPCLSFSSNTPSARMKVSNMNVNAYFTTPTPTPTVTPTNTVTPSVTPTFTKTPTVTPTITLTNTVTPTCTKTPTVTPTITLTNTVTPTITLSNTVTPTITLSPTVTPTITTTSNDTPTPTPTPTLTPSFTPTPTVTPTLTVSNTETPTPTLTVTYTPTIPPTPSTSQTPTPTPTQTRNLPEYLFFASTETNIDIIDNAPANPYPVNIPVTGIDQTVRKVALVLSGYTHSFPYDVGMLLVAPDGTTVIPVYQIAASEGYEASNVDVILDDDGTGAWDGYSAGTYHTANTNDQFAYFDSSGARPAPPYNLDLTVFNQVPYSGINGTWKLYIEDFLLRQAGSLFRAGLRIYYN